MTNTARRRSEPLDSFTEPEQLLGESEQLLGEPDEGLLPQLADEGIEAADYLGDRIRMVAHERPGALLAGAALAGFAAGILVGSARGRRNRHRQEDEE